MDDKRHCLSCNKTRPASGKWYRILRKDGRHSHYRCEFCVQARQGKKKEEPNEIPQS